MQVLVVGGTGLVGAHVAAALRARGDDVTVGARRPPDDGDLPVLIGDFARDGFAVAELERFDAVVFAAGHDPRHTEAPDERYWAEHESEGVPAFVERARDAGVRRVVQIGSCYHQALPELVERSAYVRARALADQRARALATADFAVCTLNPPPIVGLLPGRSTRRFARMVAWATGADDRIPFWAPPGGTNYLTARSLADATLGALDRGEAGAAYLVGDQNLTYQEYFGALARAAGVDRMPEVRDEDHPFLPDRMLVPGRAFVLRYEPEPAEVELLGYRRGDVLPHLEEMVQAATDAGAVRP